MRKREITKDDLAGIQYHWREHKDIEKYPLYNRIKETLKEDYGLLYNAHLRYKESVEEIEKLIDALI